MNRPAYELADVIRTFAPAFEQQYGHTVSPAQRRALRDLVRCRTAALGGHVEACDACGQIRIAYNSCRNRNCPKCQAAARAAWLDRQSADLLPVEYFHVVFTLPNALGPLGLQNPTLLYGALFRAAAVSLLTLASDPKHLGAEIGFLSVLHTWGQTLTLHPHVHCVVPGGGLSPDGQRWLSCRPGFFLPVRPLSRLFRGKYLAALQRLYQQGLLVLAGSQAELAEPRRFTRWIDELRASEWVVYAKPPFGGPEQVLKYLARYTHRVAISNQRLVSVKDRTVSFDWKDYADANCAKVMTLDGVEFLRRFLQHVLPSGFVRIRHFGLLANRHREEKLSRCRSLLNASATMDSSESLLTEGAGAAKAEMTVDEAREIAEAGEADVRCPVCGKGRMVIIEMLPRTSATLPSHVAAVADTS
jgi:putative transposase/transposase-like zinc-binding protein